MVRVKNRYLLVHILYPEDSPHAKPNTPNSVPNVVHFRSPTPDYVTLPLLLREIRDQIALLYGDYGSGVTGGGLASSFLFTHD